MSAARTGTLLRRTLACAALIVSDCTHTNSNPRSVAGPRSSPRIEPNTTSARQRPPVAPSIIEQLIPAPGRWPYARATVMVTDVLTGDARPAEVRGWLAPDPQRSSAQRLLTWNALWYPVVTVLGSASLEQDLSDEARRAPFDYADGTSYERALMQNDPWIARAIAWRAGLGPTLDPERREEAVAIQHLLEVLDSQIMFAHARGDAQRAYEIATRLARAAQIAASPTHIAMARAWLEQRSLARSSDDGRADRPGRSAEALVSQLHSVTGVFSEFELALSPRMSAILAMGEGAIDALLGAVEHDRRFTRAFETGNRGVGITGLHTVESLAGHLVVEILRPGCRRSAVLLSSGRPRHDTTETPTRATVTEYRALWNATRNLTPLERHLRAIEDDHASSFEWAQSIAALTQPHSEGCSRPPFLTPRAVRTSVANIRPTASNPMIADALLRRRDRALSVLISRRAVTSIERSAAEPDDVRLHEHTRAITYAQLFWEQDTAVLARTRAAWLAVAARDTDATAMMRAIDERVRELRPRRR